MPILLLVADRPDRFDELVQMLEQEKTVQIHWSHDGEAALESAAADSPDLVIVDEYIGETSALDWIRRLMGINAFVQTAAVSRLPHEVFHEASEGLGIMAQLPPRPGASEGQKVLGLLDQLPGAG